MASILVANCKKWGLLPEHIADKLLQPWPWHQFCEKISNLRVPAFPSNADDFRHLCFPCMVVSNCIVYCFFKEDSGAVEFLTTDSLSQKTEVDPISGMPIIRNL